MSSDDDRKLAERRARDRERWYRRYYGNKAYRERKLASKAEWQATNPEKNVAAVQRFREKWGRWPAKATVGKKAKTKTKLKEKVLASLATKRAKPAPKTKVAKPVKVAKVTKPVKAVKAAKPAIKAKVAAKTKVTRAVKVAKPAKAKVAKVTKTAKPARPVKAVKSKAAAPAKRGKPVKAAKSARRSQSW